MEMESRGPALHSVDPWYAVTRPVLAIGKRPREARNEMSPLVPALATVTGVSVRMAEAIVQSYPTARALVAASPDGISDVKCGKRAVGPVVAGRIKMLFA